MTYDYVLDFTSDGIRLLKGSGKEQTLIGEVALNDPHFETRLEDLRKEIEDETGDHVSPALMIPHTEILFHTMKIEAEDDGGRVAAIRSELEGMTPYAVGDLVYDWKAISKDQVQIAAVAKETLDEADAFAEANGFGPGPFSAQPKPGAFKGQPDFGASARPPFPPKTPPEPEPEPELDPVPEPVSAPAPIPTPESSADASEQSDPVQPSDPVEPSDPAVPSDTGDQGTEGPAPETADTSAAPDAVDQEALAADHGEVAPPLDPARHESGAPVAPPVLIDDYAEISPVRDPQAESNRADRQPPSARRGYIPPNHSSASPARSDETAGAFASRRNPNAAGSDSRLDSIASRIAMLPDAATGPKVPPVIPKPAPSDATGFDVLASGPGKPGAPGPKAPVPTVRKVEAPESATDAAQSLGAAKPGMARPRPMLTEAESLTVFGMREPPRGRASTLAPVAIAVAIALLLAVGIWLAFFFLGGEDTAENTAALSTEIAQPVAPEVTPDEVRPPGPNSDSVDAVPIETAEAPSSPEPRASDTPQGDDAPVPMTAPEIASTDTDAEAGPSADDGPGETAEAAVAEDDALLPGPDDPLRRSPDAPEATRYAATGVSTASPTGSETPASDPVDEPPLELADSTVRSLDGISPLLRPDATSLTRPGALLPPPPPGTRFELNEDGRVIATPEGVLSPAGVRITAGSPATVPPPAPNRDREPAAAQEAAAEPVVPVIEGEPEATPPLRPEDISDAAGGDQAASIPDSTDAATIAADALPRLRPETAEGTAEDAELPTLIAVAPRARPADAAPDGDTPPLPQISEEQSAEQAEAVAAAIAEIIPAIEETSPYAVAQSLRPGARPSDLAARIQQARPVQVAAAAATVTPRNPTAGSVATRATTSNALRLNAMNLIGVYGTQSNRRALVRLPSGRFIKVKVGDRVDGGQVRAIGQDQLQYVKGGRAVTLTIPQG